MNNIDILEELVNAYKDCFVENYNEMIVDVGMRYKDIQAISNLIALDQIPFAISELYFKLENSVPISLIEKKIEEYEKDYDRQDKEGLYNLTKITSGKIASLRELLDERNKNNGN